MIILKKLSAFLVVAALVVMAIPSGVTAAGLTNLSDTMTSQKTSTASDHTIVFDATSGVASTETVTITFPTAFDTSTIIEDDVDIQDGATELSTAATAGAGTWGVSMSGDVLTITAADDESIAAGNTVTIEIGSHASASGAGSNQITNPGTANTYTLEIAGTFGDTGSISVPILTDDQVSVTAEVGQTLTFSIADNSIGFGTLDSNAARYASGDENGTSSKGTTGAHDITVGTNATSGYTVTYNGSVLTHTNGTDTIGAATITSSATGTPGSEQFAIAADTDGDATIASGYEASTDNWNFAADTTTTLASETGPSSNENLGIYYLANIATLTPAGTYSTAITYTGTANF